MFTVGREDMLPIIASYWPLWISLFLLACLVAACFTTITLELYARRQKENDDATMKVSALAGLISFKVKMPKVRLNARGVGLEVKAQNGQEADAELDVKKAITRYHTRIEAIDILKDFKSWFLSLLRKVELSDWSWHSRAGTGEAMSAALSCGTLWSVKGLLFGTVSRYVKVTNSPNVTIQPLYHEKWFSTEWSCKLKLKLGSLLVASVYLIFHLSTLRKGVNLWRSLVSKV